MASFSITRTAHTTAPVEAVLPLVQDFHQWVDWSPWEGLDPDLQRTYSGSPRGVGAKYAWSGNKKAGEGSMDMTRADERGAGIDLHFTKPFKADNHVEITVTPASSGGSDLSWTMTGEQTFVSKLFFTVFRMEKQLAKDFDKGLAQLSRVAERSTEG